jgi:hypothetical protein
MGKAEFVGDVLGEFPAAFKATVLNEKERKSMSENKSAGINFLNEVQKLQKETGIDYDTAWEKARQLKPELYAAMEQPEQAPEFKNTRTGDATKRVQARENFIEKVHARMRDRKEDYDTAYRVCQKLHVELYNESLAQPEPSRTQKCGILGLDLQSSEDEVAVAWKANANSVPIKAVAIVNALTGYWAKKDGVSSEKAKAELLRRHTTLRTAYNYSVGQMS